MSFVYTLAWIALDVVIASPTRPPLTPTISNQSSSSSNPPIIIQTAGTFQYKGCYQDGVNGLPRSLLHQVPIPGGGTAETCTAACKSFGFVIAGLEFGGECWCDNYMPSALLAPNKDADCTMPCTASPTTQLCGSSNRLAIYIDTNAPPLNLHTCLTGAQLQQRGAAPQFAFDLEGQYIPAFKGAGPGEVSVSGLLGNFPVPGVSSGGLHLQELTGRSPTQPHAYTLTAGTTGNPKAALFVQDIGGNGVGSAVQPIAGGNQFFDVGVFDPVYPFFGYCAQPNPYTPSTYIGPPVLAVNLEAQVWAFCAGGTGPGGLVYARNETSGSCSDVILAMTPPLN